MKFGSNDSALKYLEASADTVKVPVFAELTTQGQRTAQEAMTVFGVGMVKHRQEMKGNVCYWTKPFFNAYMSAKKSIKEGLAYERIKAEGHYSGTLITDGSGESVVFYSLAVKDTVPGGYVVDKGFFAFFQSHALHAVYLSGVFKEGTYGFASIGMQQQGFSLEDLAEDVVNMELFKKVCELETKYLPPNNKTELYHCKYLNKTKYNIKILDSTYFTNLVKTEGFGVRGHLRLQACGEGMKERKVIWIDPYKKNGYTRRAGKIIEQGGQT